jgi:hypothetical protein
MMAENYKILAQEIASNITPAYTEEVESGPLKFVAMSQESTEQWRYSQDGVEWSSFTLPPSYQYGTWSTITYGGGKFVAIMFGAPQDYTAISEDGITWTVHVATSNGSTVNFPTYPTIAYGDSKYVAIAWGSTFLYSVDGIEWQSTSVPTFATWRSIVFGNGKFVAVSESSLAAYSTNGISWTTAEMPEGYWQSVTYGENTFVAVSAQSGGKIAYSLDGVSWTTSWFPNTASYYENYYSVAYGNGKFFVSAGEQSLISNDGISWSYVSSPLVANFTTFGAGKFVSVSWSGSAYSEDGITWTLSDIPGGTYRAIAYGLEIETVDVPTTMEPKIVYTVPANNNTAISSISFTNSADEDAEYKVAAVMAADVEASVDADGLYTISDAQTIIPTRTIEPNVVDEIVGGITLSAGDQIRVYSESEDLIVQVYGVEIA